MGKYRMFNENLRDLKGRTGSPGLQISDEAEYSLHCICVNINYIMGVT